MNPYLISTYTQRLQAAIEIFPSFAKSPWFFPFSLTSSNSRSKALLPKAKIEFPHYYIVKEPLGHWKFLRQPQLPSHEPRVAFLTLGVRTRLETFSPSPQSTCGF